MVLRWLLPAVVPTALFAWLVYRSDRRREPPRVLVGTFVLAVVLALGGAWLAHQAAAFTGLSGEVSSAGDAGSLVFLFLFVAPVHEGLTVAAAWPAVLSKHFDEPYDGVVYSSIAALGFAAVETALVLRAHPEGGTWVVRALVALPAHVFFAACWGWALGRARQRHRPGALFPGAWSAAVVAHGLYTHLVYGRGPGALVGTVPLLFAMAGVAWFAMRDLRQRSERLAEARQLDPNARPSTWEIPAPPSLNEVREALRRADQPIRVRWIVLGAMVTMGAMFAFLAGSVAFAHWAHVDFSIVDERDVTTTAPVGLLGAGLLVAFPVSGFLVARASAHPTLLEPALGSALAIVTTLALLGLAAPIALVFGLAFSPILWGLSCAGAWFGRAAN